MLSAIIMKMMAKDPAARFDDMQSVGQLLLPFASFRMKVAYAAEFSSGALTRSRAEVALHTLRSAPLLMGAGRVRKSLKYSVMAILVASGLVGLAFRSWKHNVARPMSAVASNSGKAFASSVDTVLAASVVGSQPTANDEQVSAGKRSTSATLDGTPLVRAQPKKPVPREDHVSSVRSPTATAQSAAIVAPSLDEVAPPKRGVNGALILP